MKAAPPFPVVTGQRQLAAIMFTDAVGYSAQMHEEELATLNRVERDLAAIRRIVEDRSGSVLKMTGDGLLIQFASAVEAVASALEIQRYFLTREQTGVTRSTLRHRVGIHLGDVFVTPDDVMGDGVNIAARLVAVAPPDGIVISDTVFNVVSNKLTLHTVPLGPQRLKNIKSPVTAYKVLLDAPALAAASPAAVPKVEIPVTTAPSTGGSSRGKRIAALVLLIAAVAAAGNYFWRQYLAHEKDLQQSQSAQAELGERLKAPETVPPADQAPAPAAVDFAALVSSTPALRQSVDANAATIQSATASSDLLLLWLTSELARYTRDRPLVVSGLGDPTFQGARIFTDGSHDLYFAEGGASRRRAWTELKEPVQAAIIISALRQASPPAGSELRRGAAAFAYLHGQPLMIQALANWR